MRSAAKKPFYPLQLSVPLTLESHIDAVYHPFDLIGPCAQFRVKDLPRGTFPSLIYRPVVCKKGLLVKTETMDTGSPTESDTIYLVYNMTHTPIRVKKGETVIKVSLEMGLYGIPEQE